MAEEKKWIKGAIKRPGALRETLGIEEGEKIPKERLDEEAKQLAKAKRKAEKKGTKMTASQRRLARQVSLAKTLGNLPRAAKKA